MTTSKSQIDAITIINEAHFAQFNTLSAMSRNAGTIKAFDRNVKALGMLERAAQYLQNQGVL